MSRHVLSGRPDQAPHIDSAPTIGLAWLVRLRWAFVVAEMFVAAGVTWFLGTPVDAQAVGAAASVTILTNLALLGWSKRGRPTSRMLLAAVLVLDGMLLTLALRASGGAMNPFSVLYLVHVVLAALLLDGRATLIVAGTTCLGFGTLFLGTETSPHAHHLHGGHESLDLHLRGMLVAYAVAAAFVGYFVYRVARALERREREMVALRDWAARTEKAASLSTLAAGAAHELGTPLATIALVAKELERAAVMPEGRLDRASLSSDAQLVREEAERCRRIIAKLASDAGAAQGAAPREISTEAVVTRVRASLDKERLSDVDIVSAERSAFVTVPDETLVQVLVNLVSNALDASAQENRSRVVMRVGAFGSRVAFSIEDCGSGMPEDVLSRLGEPFFSMKSGRGMGLGLFIARSFAERVGGSLTVESSVGRGSTFVLEVPGGVR
ncbi:Sensor histidine kinase PrrB (RegB) [Labilithrix luteola]|uniref:histidine kinase n=1 Tax=Labilithrix luteola TaxID=1391654 RepID=A0A0K1PPJ3_9BACT|nr:Sensor histidine kinase PrrB (RegB) [Labilithrix luteola]